MAALLSSQSQCRFSAATPRSSVSARRSCFDGHRRPLGFPISDHLEGREEEIEGRFGRFSPCLLLRALAGEVRRMLAGGIIRRFETDTVCLRSFYVLSRNPIHEIGDSLMKLTSITKLSLSHCQIQEIGSSLTSCVVLKSIRFAQNKITVCFTCIKYMLCQLSWHGT
ncbi:uncharacterized protein LOC113462950 isoform X2 [Phoenix dactylifera]|uniref:Uncharacterized protein LOC113462950 isoform X2 n=1 Tax=Phoenix dactylifera TaxID=42345 RepID=A0A8B8J6D2_PHODC|nr:uncharacterized protein LOC113462950 isoform X2 [Phoenix dactylifera]